MARSPYDIYREWTKPKLRICEPSDVSLHSLAEGQVKTFKLVRTFMEFHMVTLKQLQDAIAAQGDQIDAQGNVIAAIADLVAHIPTPDPTPDPTPGVTLPDELLSTIQDQTARLIAARATLQKALDTLRGGAVNPAGLHVTSIDPPDGLNNTLLRPTIVIEFSEPVRNDLTLGISVRRDSVLLGGAIAGSVTPSSDFMQLTFVPAADLEPDATYLITVTAADSAGNPMTPSKTRFTTRG